MHDIAFLPSRLAEARSRLTRRDRLRMATARISSGPRSCEPALDPLAQPQPHSETGDPVNFLQLNGRKPFGLDQLAAREVGGKYPPRGMIASALESLYAAVQYGLGRSTFDLQE